MQKILSALLIIILSAQSVLAFGNIEDRDLEYLLSRMEKKQFRKTYSNRDINSRIDRLDSSIFGAIQDGDYQTRLNRLRHAFSAKNNDMQSDENDKVRRSPLSSFQGFFSAGVPTSIPVSPDYYTSMQDFVDFSK